MSEESYFESLPAAECWDLLRTHEVGRVAWAATCGVTILPVNYRTDGTGLFVRTTPEGLLAELGDGLDLAFEVDHIDPDTRIAWSVLGRGRASRVTDEETVRAVLADGPRPWAAGDRPLVLRVELDEIGGRVVSGA